MVSDKVSAGSFQNDSFKYDAWLPCSFENIAHSPESRRESLVDSPKGSDYRSFKYVLYI